MSGISSFYNNRITARAGVGELISLDSGVVQRRPARKRPVNNSDALRVNIEFYTMIPLFSKFESLVGEESRSGIGCFL